MPSWYERTPAHSTCDSWLSVVIIWMKVWRKDALIRSMICKCQIVLRQYDICFRLWWWWWFWLLILNVEPKWWRWWKTRLLLLYRFIVVYLFSIQKFGLGSLLALRFLLIHAWLACFVNSIGLSMFLLLYDFNCDFCLWSLIIYHDIFVSICVILQNHKECLLAKNLLRIVCSSGKICILCVTKVQ